MAALMHEVECMRSGFVGSIPAKRAKYLLQNSFSIRSMSRAPDSERDREQPTIAGEIPLLAGTGSSRRSDIG
jgi:hypothetical protein